MTDRPKLRVGTSGWQYDHWRGVFYPDDLPKNRWFSYYAEHFDTVEINNTFYHLPSEATFDSWHNRTPRGFCYSLKFSRYGTQMKKLKDPDATIGSFMERARRLQSFLGPILVQLPPGWKPDYGRLRTFLRAAPRDVRWAVEFRNAEWFSEQVFDILRDNNVALVIHDMLPGHPREVTADWVYMRFHGVDYSREYTHEQLTEAAEWIHTQLRTGVDVYAYFNNDASAYAVANARDLRRYVEEQQK